MLEALIHSLDAIVWRADAQTLHIRFIAQQVEELLGHPQARWLNEPGFWQTQLHPDDAQRVITTCQQLTADCQPIQIEYRLRGQDGRYHWLRDHIACHYDDAQNVILEGIKFKLSDAQQSVRVQQERTKVLHEFGRIVGASLNHRDILQQSLTHLKRILNFDTASIYLSPRDEQHEFVAGIGYADEEMTTREAQRLLKDSSILSRMAQNLQPIVHSDVRTLADWIWIPGAEKVRSFMCVPLVGHDHTMVGALMLDNQHVDFFKQSDLEMVESLAQLIIVAIENAWLYEAIQHQLGEKTALLKAGTAVSSTLELPTVLTRLAQAIGSAIDVTSIYICDWQPEQHTTTVLAEHYNPTSSTRERLSDLGTMYHVPKQFSSYLNWLESRQPTVNHQSDNHLSEKERAHIQQYDGKSVLYIPLIVKDEMIGYIELWESRQQRDFTPREIALAQGMAHHAAIAIENTRLYEQARHSTKELALLHEIAVATAVTLDIDYLLQRTTELMVAKMYPHVFGFTLLNPETQILQTHHSFHGIPEEFHKVHIPLNSIAGQVVSSGKPYICGDVRHDPLYIGIVTTTRSRIAVPLQVYGRSIGAINASSPFINAFNEQDLRFLTTVAGYVATAIERARLYATLQEQADVFAKRVAERTAELQEEHDRTMAILESAGEGIALTDIEAKIIYANPAMEQQSGFSRLELIQRDATIWYSDKTSESNYRDLWAALRDGRSWSGELVSQHKNGRYYDIALTLSPIRDASDDITGFVGVQSDISHLKEVDRLKTKFVANVSHELRTPLTNIKMYLTLLERGRIEKHEHYLHVLKHETERLTRLIQDLLDLSRLETAGPPNLAAVTDTSPLLRAYYDYYSEQARHKNIRCSYKIPHSLPILIEERHFEQLMTNLLGNALAYTPPAGEIALQAAVADQDICLRVSNSGPGIIPEDLPHLFDRFYRGHIAQEMTIPGTGLGLAICQEIVERYNGRIEVHSKPYQLTTFTIWLPLASDTETKMPNPNIGSAFATRIQ